MLQHVLTDIVNGAVRSVRMLDEAMPSMISCAQTPGGDAS